jgi:hypothetical protein
MAIGANFLEIPAGNLDSPILGGSKYSNQNTFSTLCRSPNVCGLHGLAVHACILSCEGAHKALLCIMQRMGQKGTFLQAWPVRHAGQ